MAERKSYLLRLPPELMDEMNRWANRAYEAALRAAAGKRRR